jgi:hypothetical protein
VGVIHEVKAADFKAVTDLGGCLKGIARKGVRGKASQQDQQYD